MATIIHSQELDASQEQIWRLLLAVREWPEWCPIFQLVEPENPAAPLASEWQVNGLLGRIPYSGLFHVEEHRPVELLRLISIRTSPPYKIVEHEISISDSPSPTLAWRVDYALSGGPGGWLIDHLIVRGHVEEQLRRTLSALEQQITDQEDR